MISPTISGIGGIAQHVQGLTKFLENKGNDVEIISSENTFTIPIKKLKNPSFMISSFFKSKFKKNFDIVHAKNPISSLAMKNVKGKKILSLQGNYSKQILFLHGNTAGIISKKLEKSAWAQAGTVRANTANLIKGVTDGWEKKLTLIGVGYRAKAQGKVLNLTLGFSHPVNYQLPEGISVETPTQTEVVVKGIDKQKVGQAAAEIRAFRPPEPYKGKGVRYSDEQVVRKAAKKK